MKLWKSIKEWWKNFSETIRIAIHLDARAMDDPAWLTGKEPKEETKQMYKDARKRAGLEGNT